MALGFSDYRRPLAQALGTLSSMRMSQSSLRFLHGSERLWTITAVLDWDSWICAMNSLQIVHFT